VIQKDVVPFFPTSKVPRTEKITPKIYFPKENHRTTSEGTTALFLQQKSTQTCENFRWTNNCFSCELIESWIYNWRVVCFAHLNVFVLCLQDFQKKHPPIFFPPVSFHGNLQGLTEEQRRLLRLSVGKPAATTETTPLAPVYGISESVLAPSKCWKLNFGYSEVWPYDVVFFTCDDHIYIYMYDQNVFSPF